jgi:predicted RNase H-like HicB family nuclease
MIFSKVDIDSLLRMEKKKYVYWKDDEMWLGYLEEYPDYWTQAETEDELKENLVDLYKKLISILF